MSPARILTPHMTLDGAANSPFLEWHSSKDYQVGFVLVMKKLVFVKGKILNYRIFQLNKKSSVKNSRGNICLI